MIMSKNHLQCRECKKEYEPTFKYVCDECFGPLDVKYDFPSVNKNTFKDREKTYWRYFELLPIQDKKNIVSIEAGLTPLVKAEKLGKELGKAGVEKTEPVRTAIANRAGDLRDATGRSIAAFGERLQRRS